MSINIKIGHCPKQKIYKSTFLVKWPILLLIIQEIDSEIIFGFENVNACKAGEIKLIPPLRLYHFLIKFKEKPLFYY